MIGDMQSAALQNLHGLLLERRRDTGPRQQDSAM
jgi:hypothetical protein